MNRRNKNKGERRFRTVVEAAKKGSAMGQKLGKKDKVKARRKGENLATKR
jgi:hypothetical protein